MRPSQTSVVGVEFLFQLPCVAGPVRARLRNEPPVLRVPRHLG
jgi:hypothetical protein